MRLKSRTKYPPHGFSLLLPEIGMKAPISGSFNDMVQAFARIVEKNKALAEKQGWPTNRTDQENWIDQREAQRMVAHGWLNFVDLEGGSATVPQHGLQLKKKLVSVADRVKTAAEIYADLFGPGGKTVPIEEAERRASICVQCKANDTSGGFAKYFIEALSKSIMGALGMMKNLNLHTSQDAELGVCTACSCPMKAKVWPELSHIRNHTDAETMEKLNLANPQCWILETPAGS